MPEIEQLKNNKANVDLGNTIPAQSFKDMSVEWVMPDYSRMVDISSLSSYTCPCNGFLYLRASNIYAGQFSAGYINYTSNLHPNSYVVAYFSNGSNTNSAYYPVFKNEILTKAGSNGTTKALFIPKKGAEHNA